MKFTLNWLKEFVRIDAPPEELADLLTMAGLEVESITSLTEPETESKDWLFEVSVTPNRGDCLSIIGLARELSAHTGAAVKSLATPYASKAVSSVRGLRIDLAEPQFCPRYSAKLIEGVGIGTSPVRIRFRLESCGIRSINNVVDVTNYVMLESGQPLHAFDLDRLNGCAIVVRRAGDVKKFVTLDGIERDLCSDDLLVWDGDVPIALAGVMGGLNSEVTNQSKRIFLESAHFDPITVRRTAKRLGLHSEASHRFERTVDPAGTLGAAERAAGLIAEFSGGTVVPEALDQYPETITAPSILLRPGRIEKLLGIKLPQEQIEQLLTALGLRVQKVAMSNSLEVIAPTSRPDLQREVDLIEEVARLYGYQNIPASLPMLRSSCGRPDYRLSIERKIRSYLTGEGLVEVINLPFTSEAINRAFTGVWSDTVAAVPLLNPLVQEQAEMRLSLIPGLIDNLRTNLGQKAESFFAYHLGKTYGLQANGETEEKQCLSALLYGRRGRRGLKSTHEGGSSGFLDGKGLVEEIMDVLRMSETIVWQRSNLAVLHPGRAAELLFGGLKIGYLGEIHPDFQDQLSLPAFVVFELDFEQWVKYSPRQIAACSLPRYPAVERDFALVVDQAFSSQRIIDWVKDLDEPLIERVEAFDEYRGAPIPEGKKSLAYKISYRAGDRTLTDGEVNSLHQQLIERMGEVFNAQRRS